MHDWFNIIKAGSALSAKALQELREVGFVVIPGPVPPGELAQLAAVYDSEVETANPEDLSVGSTTIRVNDFVNRGPEFDEIYIYKPVLEACCYIIDRPFKLRTMISRTVPPHAYAQEIHADFKRAPDGYPMIGFIFMVDEFRPDNGATRFIPGSHKWPSVPDHLIKYTLGGYEGEVPAYGLAGSMIVFNGSVWHGHSANLSDAPRRSIQGAFIRREEMIRGNSPVRMRPETLARIGPLAKYLLDV